MISLKSVNNRWIELSINEVKREIKMSKKYRSRKDGSHYPVNNRPRSTGTLATGTAHLSIPKSVSKPIKETKVPNTSNEIIEENRKCIDVDVKREIFGNKIEAKGSISTTKKTTTKEQKKPDSK